MSSIQQTLASLGGGAAAFTPNSVASIWAYYEADSYSQADGSQIVADWQDQSANNRDATPSGALVQFRTNAINTTLPVVKFNDTGAGSYLVLPDMSALTAGSYYIVLKVDNLGPAVGMRMGTAADEEYFPLSTGNIYPTFGSTVRKPAITPSPTTLNTWNVFYGYSAANDWGLEQNGVSLYTTATNTVGFPATAWIARNQDSIWGQIQVAAMYFFSAKLSAGDNTDMLAYINGKWGV